MKIVVLIALIFTLVNCTKKDDPNAEPWNRINLSAVVNVESTPAGSVHWNSGVTFDKEVYDSIFVEIQWDVYSAPGAYVRTLKDTVRIAPQKPATINHRATSLYQPPQTAQAVKIVYAWSKAWNKYTFVY